VLLHKTVRELANPAQAPAPAPSPAPAPAPAPARRLVMICEHGDASTVSILIYLHLIHPEKRKEKKKKTKKGGGGLRLDWPIVDEKSGSEWPTARIFFLLAETPGLFFIAWSTAGDAGVARWLEAARFAKSKAPEA
jgi:hypothetical protein